jgi:hypothetical protein
MVPEKGYEKRQVHFKDIVERPKDSAMHAFPRRSRPHRHRDLCKGQPCPIQHYDYICIRVVNRFSLMTLSVRSMTTVAVFGSKEAVCSSNRRTLGRERVAMRIANDCLLPTGEKPHSIFQAAF